MPLNTTLTLLPSPQVHSFPLESIELIRQRAQGSASVLSLQVRGCALTVPPRSAKGTLVLVLFCISALVY